MNVTPTVTQVNQSSSFSSDGKLQTAYIITFKVGTHGPFTMQVPQAEFNAPAIKKKLDAFAAEINAIAPGA